jgi:hypothetical protein
MGLFIGSIDFCSVKPETCFILKRKEKILKIENFSNPTLFFLPTSKCR